MTTHQIYLGDFSVQGTNSTTHVGVQDTPPCFCWKGVTNKKRKWQAELSWERERYTRKQGEQTFTHRQWSGVIGPHLTRWSVQGISHSTVGNNHALCDSEGTWSFFPDTYYHVPLHLAEHPQCPAQIEMIEEQSWLRLSSTTQNSWHVKILWPKMKLGLNRALFRVTDAKGQIFRYQFDAVGTAGAISLAPWGGEWTNASLRRTLRLQSSDRFVFTGSLPLYFCGTGQLQVMLFFPSSGQTRRFTITNWDPLVEVVWAEDFNLTWEQVTRYTKEPLLCYVETDSAVLGLDQMEIWREKNWVASLFSWPSVVYLTPGETVSVVLYSTTNSSHPIQLPARNQWNWALTEPINQLQIQSTETSLQCSWFVSKKEAEQILQSSSPSTYLRVWNNQGDCCSIPLFVRVHRSLSPQTNRRMSSME